MAFRYFPTRDEAWLTAQLQKVEIDLAEGKTITTATAGDASSGKAVQMNVMTRRRMLLNDLSILNPATYPADCLMETKRTVPRYII